jgi:transposase-like protein
VLERQVYKYLVRDSKLSQSKLQTLFKSFLKSAPTVTIKSKQNVHLLIDATYFPNKLCLVLYYDYDINYVQLYRNTDKEKFKEIKEDLENLKRLNVQVYSVTCDGHKAILKAIKQVYPNAIIQRCLVHIKRQVKTYISEQPKLLQAKSLLQLSNKITFIKTQEQCSLWLIEFYNWYQLNKNFINEKSINQQTGRMWYTHKKLHLACSLIIKAIPNMFCYLNDEKIPYTTNKLEGYFTHLKEQLNIHKGLRFEAKKNFIKWYLHFKNNASHY